MGLQIRLRHSLGERVVEVRPRTVERPLVVGRSKEADLQIPSVTVASQHCALFVHDGQWVVQDLGGGTLINGGPVEGPTALQVGDVLSIGGGNAPATIEIDPAGVEAGRTGAPAAEVIAVAVPMAAPAYAAPGRVPQAIAVQGFAPPARSAGRPLQAPPPPPPPGGYPAANEDSLDGWGDAGTSDSVPQRRYFPEEAVEFLGHDCRRHHRGDRDRVCDRCVHLLQPAAAGRAEGKSCSAR